MAYFLARVLLAIYFFVYHRMAVYGREQLPYKRPFIIAANHTSYLDPPAIGVSFPGKLRFIAWDGLFSNFLFSWLIQSLGAIPVSQENKRRAAGLLLQTVKLLEGGSDFLIFPEGERSQDGKLKPLEGGVALLAMKTNAPIVPVWIEGTYKALSTAMSFPRPKKIRIFYGKPIDPAALPEALSDKEKRKILLDKLTASLLELSRKAAAR